MWCRFLIIFLLFSMSFGLPPLDRNPCEDMETYPLENGKCFPPLSMEPCEEGHWTVIMADKRMRCQAIPCKEGQALFARICVPVFEKLACPKSGERLYVNQYGKGFCDCDDDWERGDDGVCYEHVIHPTHLIDSLRKGVCSRRFTWNENRRRCVKLYRGKQQKQK